LTQERTVQTGIPEQYHEVSDTLLRLSGIEYGLLYRASADRVSLYDVAICHTCAYLLLHSQVSLPESSSHNWCIASNFNENPFPVNTEKSRNFSHACTLAVPCRLGSL